MIRSRYGAPNSASIARSVSRCPPCAAGSMSQPRPPDHSTLPDQQSPWIRLGGSGGPASSDDRAQPTRSARCPPCSRSLRPWRAARRAARGSRCTTPASCRPGRSAVRQARDHARPRRAEPLRSGPVQSGEIAAECGCRIQGWSAGVDPFDDQTALVTGQYGGNGDCFGRRQPPQPGRFGRETGRVGSARACAVAARRAAAWPVAAGRAAPFPAEIFANASGRRPARAGSAGRRAGRRGCARRPRRGRAAGSACRRSTGPSRCRVQRRSGRQSSAASWATSPLAAASTSSNTSA